MSSLEKVHMFCSQSVKLLLCGERYETEGQACLAS